MRGAKIMYTLKMSYGDFVDVDDEPVTVTAEILGTYESLHEAREAARDKFDDIMDILGDLDVRFDAIARGRCNYYVAYRYLNDELGRLFAGYAHYYRVSVIER